MERFMFVSYCIHFAMYEGKREIVMYAGHGNGSLSSLRFVPCQRPLCATIQIDETDEFIHIAMFYQRTSPGTTTERRSSRS